MPATSESSSTFKDVSIIMATSGVTTLNVRLHSISLSHPLSSSSCSLCVRSSQLATRAAFAQHHRPHYAMPPEQVFLNGALTVALPTIGKDLHFKEVRVCLIGLSGGCPRGWGELI